MKLGTLKQSFTCISNVIANNLIDGQRHPISFCCKVHERWTPRVQQFEVYIGSEPRGKSLLKIAYVILESHDFFSDFL